MYVLVEGIDGVGKTTAIDEAWEKALKYLPHVPQEQEEENRIYVAKYKEPFYWELFEDEMKTWQDFFKDRLLFLHNSKRDSLYLDGVFSVSDRSFVSTLAYNMGDWRDGKKVVREATRFLKLSQSYKLLPNPTETTVLYLPGECVGYDVIAERRPSADIEELKRIDFNYKCALNFLQNYFNTAFYSLDGRKRFEVKYVCSTDDVIQEIVDSFIKYVQERLTMPIFMS